MIKYNEFLLLESFDISSSKPIRLTPTYAKNLMLKYLGTKYTNPNDVITKIFDSYQDFKMFEYDEENEKYIVFFGKAKGSKYYEIQFNNIKYVDNFLNIGVLKSSQKLLSFLFSIIYYYGLRNSLNIF